MLSFLLVFSLLIPSASSYFVDAGANNEDMSIITGRTTWNHVGSDRLAILGTETPSYYRSHRSGPDFTYTMRGFEKGVLCNVTLGFAEIWGANCVTGTRIMDIYINNVRVKKRLDVFETVGCFTAHTETFLAEADTFGNIKIRLWAIRENAMISSINVKKAIKTASDSSSSSDDDPSTQSSSSSSDDRPSTQSSAIKWTDKNEDENYVARHECAFVQAGTKFYMFGGREMGQQLDVYDYTTNTWSQGAKLPKELNHFQAVEYEGLIWVVGGFHDNNFPHERATENVYVYDPANNSWMQGPQIPVQRRRGGGGVVVYDGRLYVMGGNTCTLLEFLPCLDFISAFRTHCSFSLFLAPPSRPLWLVCPLDGRIQPSFRCLDGIARCASTT